MIVYNPHAAPGDSANVAVNQDSEGALPQESPEPSTGAACEPRPDSDMLEKLSLDDTEENAKDPISACPPSEGSAEGGNAALKGALKALHEEFKQREAALNEQIAALDELWDRYERDCLLLTAEHGTLKSRAIVAKSPLTLL